MNININRVIFKDVFAWGKLDNQIQWEWQSMLRETQKKGPQSDVRNQRRRMSSWSRFTRTQPYNAGASTWWWHRLGPIAAVYRPREKGPWVLFLVVWTPPKDSPIRWWSQPAKGWMLGLSFPFSQPQQVEKSNSASTLISSGLYWFSDLLSFL